LHHCKSDGDCDFARINLMCKMAAMEMLQYSVDLLYLESKNNNLRFFILLSRLSKWFSLVSTILSIGLISLCFFQSGYSNLFSWFRTSTTVVSHQYDDGFSPVRFSVYLQFLLQLFLRIFIFQVYFLGFAPVRQRFRTSSTMVSPQYDFFSLSPIFVTAFPTNFYFSDLWLVLDGRRRMVPHSWFPTCTRFTRGGPSLFSKMGNA